MKMCLFAALGMLVAVGVVRGAELSPAEQQGMLKELAPSAVCVEYVLQYDKGEEPRGSGWSERCPNCGRHHGDGTSSLVAEERPLEVSGWLIEGGRVLTRDLMLHPRFVKSISVRLGTQRVAAKPAAYMKDQNAMLLELAEPLKGGKALAFDAARKGPYFAVTRANENGAWTATVRGLSTFISETEDGRRFIAAPTFSLIVDKSGAAVGACMNEQLPLDDSWKGSPARWPVFSAEELARVQDAIEKRVNAGVLRVTLGFRSPKANAERERFRGRDDENPTRADVLGLLLPDRRILILSSLRPEATARLERITVHPENGPVVSAKFLHSLNDAGAFIATLEKPMGAELALATGDIRQLTAKLLFSAELRVQGEKRVVNFGHRRIAEFKTGWRQQIFPDVDVVDKTSLFLLDEKGALVVLPMAQRAKPSLEDRWRSSSYDRERHVAAGMLAKVLADLPNQIDAANVPLSEEDDARIAWMGVELQGLNKELAQANNVSDLTRDGETGALVTYVYPDSPAGKAGVQAGAVLLRLHIAGQPAPLDVKVQDEFESREFPWDRLDEVPDQYFDRIPKPWPPVDSVLNKALTSIGLGKKYTAEFVQDSKPLKQEFTIIESPAHFDSAPKYKAESLGLTVRELTYEVKRYMQFKDGDPGVIIAKIERGSKASTSGLKPYELVTQINDAPVRSVKDFEKLIAGQTELRMSIKRMSKERQVKVSGLSK